MIQHTGTMKQAFKITTSLNEYEIDKMIREYMKKKSETLMKIDAIKDLFCVSSSIATFEVDHKPLPKGSSVTGVSIEFIFEHAKKISIHEISDEEKGEIK